MWHDTALLSSCTCLLPWGLVSLLAPSHPCPGLPSSSPAPDGWHSGRTLAKADVFIFRRQNVVLLQMAVPRSKWQPLTLLPRSLGILTDRAGSLLVTGKLKKKKYQDVPHGTHGVSVQSMVFKTWRGVFFPARPQLASQLAGFSLWAKSYIY